MRQPRTTHPTCRGPGPTRCTPSTPRQATAKPSRSGHIPAAGLLGLDKAVHPTPIPGVDCLVPFELARKHRGPAVDLTFLQPPRLRVPVLQLQLEEERVPQGGGGREVLRPSVGEGRQPQHTVAHRQPLAPRLVLPGVRDAQVRYAPVNEPPSVATSSISRSVASPNALRQSRHVHSSSVRWTPRQKSASVNYAWRSNPAASHRSVGPVRYARASLPACRATHVGSCSSRRWIRQNRSAKPSWSI